MGWRDCWPPGRDRATARTFSRNPAGSVLQEHGVVTRPAPGAFALDPLFAQLRQTEGQSEKADRTSVQSADGAGISGGDVHRSTVPCFHAKPGVEPDLDHFPMASRGFQHRLAACPHNSHTSVARTAAAGVRKRPGRRAFGLAEGRKSATGPPARPFGTRRECNVRRAMLNGEPGVCPQSLPGTPASGANRVETGGKVPRRFGPRVTADGNRGRRRYHDIKRCQGITYRIGRGTDLQSVRVVADGLQIRPTMIRQLISCQRLKNRPVGPRRNGA